MFETHGMTIAKQTGVTRQQIEAVRSLLDTGSTLTVLEDVYLPSRPKRCTRGRR